MVVIRRATRSDLDAVVALNAQVHEIHVAERPDYFRATGVSELAKWMRGMFDDASSAIWVAEQDARPVGYLLAMTRERPGNPLCHDRLALQIDQIAVDAEVRGTGIGRALIERALEHAEEQAIPFVELNVWSFNDVARAVFERMGFEARNMTMERR